MTDKRNPETVDHLIFLLSNQLYALPSTELVQIIDAPAVTIMPNIAGNVRGAINFHGEMVVLYDLRKCLGITTLEEEIADTNRILLQRKQDHINWLSKLKDEVYHDREISVQIDPHKCAFGKWYDHFRPESTVLKDFMGQFDAPHKHIHRLAVQAQALIRAGKKEEAKDLIHAAEQREFTTLIKLFDRAEENIRNFTYEYAVVIENAGSKLAISVDAVRSFECFDEITYTLPAIMKRSGAEYVRAIGRRRTKGGTDDVLVLDIHRVLWS